MTNIPRVKMFVTGFYKGNKEGVAVKYEVSIPLRTLQKIFNIPLNHPDVGEIYMIADYPIKEKEATALQPYVPGQIDTNKYVFMLTCESSE